MSFLERAIKNGISKGISNAVGNAVKQAVEPKATAYANKVADELDQAAQNVSQQTNEAAQQTARATGGLEGAFANLQQSMENYATQAAKNMKICPKCQTPSSADKTFCPNCGAASTVSSANIEYHARILAQKFVARQLINYASTIEGKAFDESSDIDELMQEAEGSLFELSQKNMRQDYTQIAPVVLQAKDLLLKASQHEGGLTGVPTGYYKLESTAAHLPNNKSTFIVTIAWKSSDGATIERFQLGIDYKTSYTSGGPTLWSRTYTNSSWREWRAMTWTSGTNDDTLNEKIADLESRLAALEGGNA